MLRVVLSVRSEFQTIRDGHPQFGGETVILQTIHHQTVDERSLLSLLQHTSHSSGEDSSEPGSGV